MDFVKIRKPFSTDAEGNIESCLLGSSFAFTNGDIERLKRIAEECSETAEDDETFDEFIERVIEIYNDKYHQNLSVVFPSYEVDV